MKWKTHISSLNHRCVSVITSNDLAALAQPSAKSSSPCLHQNICFVPSARTLILKRQQCWTQKEFLLKFTQCTYCMMLPRVSISVSVAMRDVLWQCRQQHPVSCRCSQWQQQEHLNRIVIYLLVCFIREVKLLTSERHFRWLVMMFTLLPALATVCNPSIFDHIGSHPVLASNYLHVTKLCHLITK